MLAVDALEALELVGSSQWGLVTTAQAAGAGVSKMQLSRLTGRGTLLRVRHGVYALPSAAAGPLQGLRAAWLAAGPDHTVVVSGQSAATVHGLGELVPARYEFTVSARRQTSQADLRYRRAPLPAADVVTVDGLPVTSLPRTVHDLTMAGTDVGHLAVVVKDALESGTHASALAAALDPGAHRYKQQSGQELLAWLLDVAGHRPDHGALDLYADRLHERLLTSLTPRVRGVVDQMFTERLSDLSPVTGDVLDHSHGELARSATTGAEMTLAAVRDALSAMPLPEFEAFAAGVRATMNARDNKNRKTVGAGTTESAPGGTAETVAERPAHQ